MRTGALIVYTSADSVFQIAAHEAIVPIPELYRVCEIAYTLVGEGLGVGRVIARPFVGAPGHFKRTSNRHDYALPPSGETLLDRLKAASMPVVAVGKIEDLFAARGITRALHTVSDDDGMDKIEQQMRRGGSRVDLRQPGRLRRAVRSPQRRGGVCAQPGALRRQTAGGPRAAEAGRPARGHRRSRQRPDDAEHGPFAGYVPLLATGARVHAGADLGTRATFADLGQTLADVFGVGRLANGTSFLQELLA